MPGRGSDLGAELSLARQDCADKCTEKQNCLSFEHSETKTLCNLNRVAEPTKGPNQDFVVCVKRHGMHLI